MLRLSVVWRFETVGMGSSIRIKLHLREDAGVKHELLCDAVLIYVKRMPMLSGEGGRLLNSAS
jgi:hypothetical protein